MSRTLLKHVATDNQDRQSASKRYKPSAVQGYAESGFNVAPTVAQVGHRSVGSRLCLLTIMVALLVVTSLARGQDQTVFGPKDLSISDWHFHFSRHVFSADAPGDGYLVIQKTTPDKAIQGGFLFFNRRLIPLRRFFTSDEAITYRDVGLRPTNRLIVFLRGTPEAAVRLEVRSSDSPIPPPQVSFQAEPMSITIGDAATLTWQIEHADLIVIDHDIGEVSESGTNVVTPQETTTYVLAAIGPGGSTTATVTISVDPMPPTVDIGADPESIYVGRSSTLSWISDHAESCVIEPDVGVVDPEGWVVVSPVETTTYTIVASGDGGTTTDSVTVTVTQPVPAVTLIAEPDAVHTGESATLSWTSENAATCVIEPDIGPVETVGSITVSPAAATTYTVTATGPGGSATDSVTIILLNTAPVAIAQTVVTNEDVLLTITLTGSDLDADPLAYAVLAGPGHGALDGAPPELLYTPDPNFYGTDSFSFKVNDGTEDSEAAIVTVTVNSVNDPPVAHAGPDQEVVAGDTVLLDASGSYDIEQDPLTYAWAFASMPSESGAVLSDPFSVTPSFTADAAGVYELELVVDDGRVASTPDTVRVTAETPMVSVPDVCGLSRQEAQAAIEAGELTTGTVTEEHSDTVPQDFVISQDPPPDAVVEAGSAVDLVVSLGPAQTTPTVSLSASPQVIAPGQSATLAWQSTNAETAFVEPEPGAVAVSGSAPVSPSHTTTYTIMVSGPEGNAAARVTVWVTGSPEPQPKGSFGKFYEDLIPTDATVATYDPKRFSLITGQVQNADGAGMEGVSVIIHKHMEYGTAITDTTGRFSIPVEGGATMTVAYQKDGFLPSQRKVNVLWNDIAIVETITMIAEDPAATTVTFDGNPETVVTHQSTTVTDEFGSRSCTMVFSGDNHAYLVDENGNDIHELTTITTRATEYATPESMPAKLPPTSAYTYCAELGVDGVKRVRFEKPVVTWVDNFLGFDVGMAVPIGYYNRDQGLWIPEENGVVAKLLDTDADGVVDALDADGDGLADDLDGDGSFNDEVAGLDDPQRYPPDATFWRVGVRHFSAWDCNWPCAPVDGIAPNPSAEPINDVEALPEEDCSNPVGSAVNHRSRIFHEDIPIPQTDVFLHYTSGITDGYKNAFVIPASGSTVPTSLKRIIVQVRVAGRTMKKVLPAAPDQTAQLTWDGLDHLGRPGISTVAEVLVGFVYDAFYYQPGTFQLAFGQAGLQSTAIPARQEVTHWKRSAIRLPIARRSIAQGWSLSAHHQYDPTDASVLFKGDGTILTEATLIQTVAGTGTAGYSGDGSPGSEASLDSPHGVAVDASGNLYIADSDNNRIRKLDRNGTITTVAGNGSRGFGGDGGPATQASLSNPYGICLDDSGDLFIADFGNHRVRRVDPNGIITTVAGTGTYGSSGDNGPAAKAQLFTPTDVAVDSSGNLYIAERSAHRVRKVDPGGIITTVAGSGDFGYSGDGGPAVSAKMGLVFSLDIDAFGNLYIVDYGNHRIRKVDQSGIITTVAGKGWWSNTGDGGPATDAGVGYPSSVAVNQSGDLYIAASSGHRIRKVNTEGIITTVVGNGVQGYAGDNGPATLAELHEPWGVAVDCSGNLYIADTKNHVVRKVAVGSSRVAGLGPQEVIFPDKNGRGYILNMSGRHEKTIDLDTGVVLWEFTYNENDQLVSIIDRFGDTITINRDADGVPIEIVAPDGITTGLTIDANNHLTQITYPDGGQYQFEYTTDGLMTAKIEPVGNHFEHVFDETGRLTNAMDEEGGHWTYTRTASASGDILTQVLTGEGDLTSYLDHTESTGAYSSTITGPTGAETLFDRSSDGLAVHKSLPCGMDLDFQYAIDPEYKFKRVSQIRQSTTSGLAKTAAISKTYEDTDANDIPDLITETVTLNGKPTSLVNNVLQSQKTVTSSEGRTVTTHYDPATLLTSSLSIPGLYDTLYAYDARGRLTSILTNTRETTFAYNAQGLLDSMTDPENHTTSYTHDAVGRITEINRPDGTVVGFTYDQNGNMTVLTNPNGIDHGFAYNAVNRTSAYQAPLSGSYTYVYDKDRRLIQTNFPSGNRIENLYTGGRLAQVQTPEGNIHLTYICSTKVQSISKGTESITYGYDGKLVTSEALGGTLGQTLAYGYNDDFNLTSFTYAGSTGNYIYDNDGLLTEAGDFTINRNPDNGLPGSVVGGPLNLARAFNGYGEVEAQDLTVNGAGLTNWSLIRDDTGRITGRTETVDGVTSNYVYTYDPSGRLLTVTKDGSLVEAYQYSLNGTRTYEMNAFRGIAGRSFDYSDEDCLLSVGTITYEYDADGFLTTITNGTEITTYDYSSRGELLSVGLPDGTVIDYVYDPLGRRIAKQVNGTVTEKYLWQGFTRLLAVYDGADTLVMRFEYADGRMPPAMTRDGQTYYLAYDQVGALRLVADASGNVVKTIDYDAFGNVIADSNPAFVLPFGFAGGLYDPDTGLVHFGFRDYDPDTGRWTAKDPLLFAGGNLDLYGYCLGDPVNWVDPAGLVNWGPIGKGALATLGGGIAVVGGALASATGGGAIGGVPAVVGGSAAVGWGISHMITGCLDNEIPFMGIKEAVIQGSIKAGLLRDELLGLNTLVDSLLTSRSAPSSIGKINTVIQFGYSTYSSASAIVNAIQDSESDATPCSEKSFILHED